MLVGLSLNTNIKNLELNLSMSALGSGGSQVLECLIANIRCIGSLDISDNGPSLLAYLLWHDDCDQASIKENASSLDSPIINEK